MLLKIKPIAYSAESPVRAKRQEIRNRKQALQAHARGRSAASYNAHLSRPLLCTSPRRPVHRPFSVGTIRSSLHGKRSSNTRRVTTAASSSARCSAFVGQKLRQSDMAAMQGVTKPKIVFDWRAEAVEHAPGSALQMTQTVASKMFKAIPGSTIPSEVRRTYKVTVVGVGNVGMACAQTVLTQDLCDELALVDVVEEKLKGEMLDLQHAAAFLPRARILADTDYKVTAGSDICIVTAGARQREGESRLALVEKNVSLFKKIIPQLVKHSPNTTLLIISNPVDALTYVAYKLAGLPPNRVIGSGTNLDSSRFRWLLADRFDVNAQNVHGYIVGEHGDSSVPLWSSVSVGGVPLIAYLKEHNIDYSSDTLAELHRLVVDGAYEVIKLKGYTSWAIGYSVASLVKSLLRDQRRIHPVSVCAQGFHGIKDEVYLSLPAEIGRAGILGVMDSPLTDEEREQLQKSAKTLAEIQKKLDI